MKEALDFFKNEYNIKLDKSCAYMVCNKKRKSHKEHIFEYATKEEYEEYINQQGNSKIS